MATGLFSGTLRAYPDPSFPGCNSAFIQPVYFSKSVFVLLSATTLWPHFRLSAERHLVRLFRSLCRGGFRLPLVGYVSYIPCPRSCRAGNFTGFAHDRSSLQVSYIPGLSFRLTFYILLLLPLSFQPHYTPFPLQCSRSHNLQPIRKLAHIVVLLYV